MQRANLRYRILILFLGCFLISLEAQVVNRAEYFIDQDPGPGQGISLPVAAPGESVTFPVSVPVPGNLSVGLHTLHIRTFSSEGAWSLSEARTFSVKGANSNIIRGEFFINEDPGHGKGIPLDVGSGGTNISFNASIPVPPNLGEGMHSLHIRTQNQNGQWSFAEKRVFVARNDSLYPVVCAEYFFDSIPDFGGGIVFDIDNLSDTAWFTKLIQVPGLPLGSHVLYLRVKDSKGRWSLVDKREFDVCESYGPVAAFSYRQNFMLFSFSDSSRHGSSYHWDFGDGKTDTVRNPLHLYAESGVYEVCLTVGNACGTSEACTTIVIGGIESIDPEKGGQGGRVSTVVSGYGFDSTVSVCLIKSDDSTKVLYPDTIKVFNDQTIFMTLNLANADTGYYDVVLKFPEGSDQVLLRGFEVVAYREPEMAIKMPGGLWARTERFIRINVQIFNSGNVDGYLVPVHITNLPDGMLLEPGFELVDMTGYEFYNSTITQLEEEGVDRDDILSPRTRDEENGTHGISVLVPQVPPGRPMTLSLSLRASQPGEVDVKATVQPPLLRNHKDAASGDCFGTVLNCAIKIALEELLSRSKWDDCAKSLTAAMDQIITDVVGVDGGSAGALTIAMGGKAKSGAVSDILSNKAIAYGTHIFKVLRDCGPIAINILPAGKIKRIIDLTVDILTKGEKLLSKGGAYACIYDSWKSCYPQGRSTTTKRLIFVTSFDPNDKTGPGIVNDHYINGKEALDYVIRFENVDSATAAAQKVVVIDSIDIEKFDLSSFEFTAYGFGDNFLSVYPGNEDFTDILDLRPEHPNLLKVEGKIDRETGVIRWEFLTLDTNTLQRTDHPLEGFLPPNVDSPEGEGMISYSIRLREEVKRGDSLMNVAYIYFDENKPIITNNWLNEFDDESPASKVTDLASVSRDTTVMLEWTGTDDLSGIRHVDIFVVEDDSLTYTVAEGLTKKTISFSGRNGSNYKFFSVATDSAGNMESVSGIDAETTIDISTGQARFFEDLGIETKIYPNPVRELIFIDLDLATEKEINIRLLDLKGREVLESPTQVFLPGKHHISLDLSGLYPGVYLAQISSQGFTYTERVMVVY